jgi:hypothetical protein
VPETRNKPKGALEVQGNSASVHFSRNAVVAILTEVAARASSQRCGRQWLVPPHQ